MSELINLRSRDKLVDVDYSHSVRPLKEYGAATAAGARYTSRHDGRLATFVKDERTWQGGRHLPHPEDVAHQMEFAALVKIAHVHEDHVALVAFLGRRPRHLSSLRHVGSGLGRVQAQVEVEVVPKAVGLSHRRLDVMVHQPPAILPVLYLATETFHRRGIPGAHRFLGRINVL